jgi:tetratricopeptide (TPR) repeat protein
MAHRGVRFAVLSALLSVLPAIAVAASMPPAGSQAGDPEPPPADARKPPRAGSPVEQALGDIVALLQANRRDEARALLAQFVAAHGAHPVALEIEGTLALDEGRLAEAEEALRRSLAMQSSASATAKLGVVRLRRGAVAEGRDLLQKALAADPTQSLAAIELARLEASQGNYGGAIGLYRRLLNAHPAPPAVLTQLHLELAETYVAARQFREARAVLAGRMGDNVPPAMRAAALRIGARASLALKDAETAAREIGLLSVLAPPSDLGVATLAARLDALKGNVEGGASRLKTAMESVGTPGFPLHLALARYYAAADQTQPAADEFHAALAVLPPDTDPEPTVTELANVLLNGGDSRKVEQVFETYAARFPAHPRIAVMAASMIATRDPTAALARLDKIQASGADLHELHFLRAQILAATGKPKEAIEAIRAATRLDPQNIKYWASYSSLAHTVGGHKMMAEVLKEGLKANPGNPDLLFDLALTDDEEGRPSEAERGYRQILKADPQHIPALIALARNRSAAPGGADEAKRLIAAALQLRPDDPEVKADYAMILHRTGDNRAALAILESLARGASKDAMLQYRLATVYRASGDEAKALAAGRTALSSGLTGPPAEELRKWVR